jgi:hypothetical protein
MDVSPWIVKRKGGESGLYYWRKGVKIWSFAENSRAVKSRSAGLRQRYTSAQPEISVVVNWTEEFKENAPPRKP